jgi:hypothetical protein
MPARRDEREAGVGIEEALDQPRTGDPVDVDPAAVTQVRPETPDRAIRAGRTAVSASAGGTTRSRAAIASNRPSAISRPGASKKSIATAVASCASSLRSSTAALGGGRAPAQRGDELRRALADPLVVGRARGLEQ